MKILEDYQPPDSKMSILWSGHGTTAGREILMKIQASAVLALHEAAEAYLI